VTSPARFRDPSVWCILAILGIAFALGCLVAFLAFALGGV
jgi:hypothetical protein